MATSANFPRDFGRFVAKSHLACEERTCMVRGSLNLSTPGGHVCQHMQEATPDLVKLVRAGFHEA